MCNWNKKPIKEKKHAEVGTTHDHREDENARNIEVVGEKTTRVNFCTDFWIIQNVIVLLAFVWQIPFSHKLTFFPLLQTATEPNRVPWIFWHRQINDAVRRKTNSCNGNRSPNGVDTDAMNDSLNFHRTRYNQKRYRNFIRYKRVIHFNILVRCRD